MDGKICAKRKICKINFRKKRVAFLQNCEKTFWVVTAQWEEKTREKSDPVVKNDYAFLL